MMADMIHSKKLDSIVTELFIRGRKLNIFLLFNTQFQKMLDWILLIFLLQKFQIEGSFKKLHDTIHQTLVLKISLISTENVLLNHLFFS